MNNTRKVALAGVLTSLALVLSYIESLIPISFAVPGIKLGLANLVTIIFIYRFKLSDTVIISIVRIVLAGILFGNLMTISYSFAGALLSIIVMFICKRFRVFSMTGVSVCGAVSHNVGQIIAASILMESSSIFYYIPWLILSGTVAGLIIGVLASIINSKIKLK